jgi:16S rRNA (uracil1498-N3)-methyltransferase
MDWLLQKAAELGAGCICPVYTKRTVVRSNGKNGNRGQRWVSILLEAAKQSGRARIPDLEEPVALEVFLDRNVEGRRFFLSENGGVPLREMVARDLEAGLPASAVLAVGPEGGWSGEEERMLARRGYDAVTLGRYVLRAETAAVCGLAVLTHYWNG